MATAARPLALASYETQLPASTRKMPRTQAHNAAASWPEGRLAPRLDGINTRAPTRGESEYWNFALRAISRKGRLEA